MKLLILGGTVFLGRHLVDAALGRGHQVTLFNRGQHNPELYPEVEKLRGDRGGDLSALRGRRWGAVIDTCGYVPRVASASASLLADHVEYYAFVSSISVYADFGAAGMDESAAVGCLEDESVEEITGQTYGPLKALCERAVEKAMPGRALSVRAGLIVGPHDPTDRFTYWVRRAAQGGDVLAPGKPDAPVQWIDARDLAGWMVRMAEERCVGTYNATGPAQRLSMGDFLNACKRVSKSDAAFVWVDEEFLLKEQVTPFTQLPLWLPRDSAGVMEINSRKAIGAGLTFRPMEQTVREALAWDCAREQEPLKAGLTLEREKELLQRWRKETASPSA